MVLCTVLGRGGGSRGGEGSLQLAHRGAKPCLGHCQPGAESVANPWPWPDGVRLRADPPQWETVTVHRGRCRCYVALAGPSVLIPREFLTSVASDHKGAPHAASQRQEPRPRPSSGLRKAPPLASPQLSEWAWGRGPLEWGLWVSHGASVSRFFSSEETGRWIWSHLTLERL